MNKEEKTRQHVQVTNSATKNITSNKATEAKKFYTDIVVYAAMRKFLSSGSEVVYVGVSKIAELATMSQSGVKAAIDRLIDNGDIEKLAEKSKDKNRNGYRFLREKEKFEMFDFAFLENKQLDAKQKAFYILLQKYLYVDKETGVGSTTYTDKEIAEKTGMSERTVAERRREFEKMGLINKRLTNKLTKLGDGTMQVGQSVMALEFNLLALGQQVLCKRMEEVENKVEDHESRLRELEQLIKRHQIKDNLEDGQIVL